MFTHTHLNVGPLLPKQKTTLEYPYNGINIISLSASCGCSNVRDVKEKSRVVVDFTANDIPPHLLDKGGYTTEQHVIVNYTIENSVDVQTLKLTFKAIVHDGRKR